MINRLIYGGTFDPIHNGHLATALQVQRDFNFDEFVFLPCHQPLLKNNAVASPQQRLAMLELAIMNNKSFKIDASQINRPPPSYMVDSLQSMRKQLGPKIALTLLMGEDSFHQLNQWHAWKSILTLTNLLIIKRAGFNKTSLAPELIKLLAEHETSDPLNLKHSAQGFIYRYDAGQYELSSSFLREQLKMKKSVDNFLPDAVAAYISDKGLYKIPSINC